jgi:hypothetical protein
MRQNKSKKFSLFKNRFVTTIKKNFSGQDGKNTTSLDILIILLCSNKKLCTLEKAFLAYTTPLIFIYFSTSRRIQSFYLSSVIYVQHALEKCTNSGWIGNTSHNKFTKIFTKNLISILDILARIFGPTFRQIILVPFVKKAVSRWKIPDDIERKAPVL